MSEEPQNEWVEPAQPKVIKVHTQRSLNTNFHDQHPHANYVPSELPAVDIPPPGASYMPDPVEHQDEVN